MRIVSLRMLTAPLLLVTDQAKRPYLLNLMNDRRSVLGTMNVLFIVDIPAPAGIIDSDLEDRSPAFIGEAVFRGAAHQTARSERKSSVGYGSNKRSRDHEGLIHVPMTLLDAQRLFTKHTNLPRVPQQMKPPESLDEHENPAIWVIDRGSALGIMNVLFMR